VAAHGSSTPGSSTHGSSAHDSSAHDSSAHDSSASHEHLSAAAAQAWIDRWDSQQRGFLPDREERFTALIDTVTAAAGRPDPLVIDLGCGPGSLATRLLDRIPAATVVAIDADPVLLTLGRAAYAGRPGLRFVDQDLRTAGWTAALDLDRPADAAVSTTALHWLPQPGLAAVYAELATVLRPGGVLLNGDHLEEDAAVAPTLARLGNALIEAEEQRCFPAGHAENWADWWTAALADPDLAQPVAVRESRHYSSDHHGSESRWLHTHVTALRAAGFAEIGTLWQRGSNRLLCAVAAPP
jgi:SAM-dependent methyltransferase